MPQVGFTINGEDVLLDDALAAARRGEIPYPPALLKALFNGRQDPVPTASALGGCLREWEYKRTHDYYEAPERGLAAMFGTGVHAELEKAGDGGKQEHRLAGEVFLPGMPAPYNVLHVTGTVDHIDAEAGTVLDWKTKAYLPRKNFQPSPRHVIQVHVYAWLHSKQPGAVPLERWQICYLDQKTTQTFTGRLRPLAGVEAWITERLQLWADYRLGRAELPYCDERYCTTCREGLLLA